MNLSPRIVEPRKSPKLKTLTLLAAAGAAVLLIGCAATQRPPAEIEQRFFDVKTNVSQTVEVVPEVIAVTNTADGTVVPLTNYLTVTNITESYVLTPNEKAQAVTAIGATVGNYWGFGGAAAAIIGGIFGLWGIWRSRQATATNAELAQTIETGRAILRALPNGDKYEAAWKDWMVKHQAETETIATISTLVATAVDSDSARGAADQIVKLIAAAK